MVAFSIPSAERTGAAPMVVQRPRRTDAVGDALRQAFVPSRPMPDQFGGVLRRLDTLD